MASVLRVDFEKGSFGLVTGILGRGSFGVVRRIEQFTEEPCLCGLFSKAVHTGRSALKTVTHVDSAEREIAIYQKLNRRANSTFLTLLFHKKVHKDCYLLGLTLFDAPNLRTVLERSRLEAIEIMHIISQSFAALSYLESPGVEIVHADLNPRNILWKRSVQQLKIIDFGSASMPGMNYPKLVCTGPYRAPSVLFDQPYSHEVDRWALGCIIYELPLGGDKPLFKIDIEKRIHALNEEMRRHPDMREELEAKAKEICDYDDPEIHRELAARFRAFIGSEAPPLFRLSPDYPKEKPKLGKINLLDHFINEYLRRKPAFGSLSRREENTLRLCATLVRHFVNWKPGTLDDIKKTVDAEFFRCYTL